MPAPARYCSAGEPIPPSPISTTVERASAACPAPPISGSTMWRAKRSRRSRGRVMENLLAPRAQAVDRGLRDELSLRLRSPQDERGFNGEAVRPEERRRTSECLEGPLGLELPQQAAHVTIHVGVPLPEVLDQPHRVDHGRVIAPAELASDL